MHKQSLTGIYTLLQSSPCNRMQLHAHAFESYHANASAVHRMHKTADSAWLLTAIYSKHPLARQETFNARNHYGIEQRGGG